MFQTDISSVSFRGLRALFWLRETCHYIAFKVSAFLKCVFVKVVFHATIWDTIVIVKSTEKLLAFSFNSRLSLSYVLQNRILHNDSAPWNFQSIYEKIPAFCVVFSKDIGTGLKVSSLFKKSNRSPALSLELC